MAARTQMYDSYADYGHVISKIRRTHFLLALFENMKRKLPTDRFDTIVATLHAYANEYIRTAGRCSNTRYALMAIQMF